MAEEKEEEEEKEEDEEKEEEEEEEEEQEEHEEEKEEQDEREQDDREEEEEEGYLNILAGRGEFCFVPDALSRSHLQYVGHGHVANCRYPRRMAKTCQSNSAALICARAPVHCMKLMKRAERERSACMRRHQAFALAPVALNKRDSDVW